PGYATEHNFECSEHYSDIDMIVENTNFNISQVVKRPCRLIPRLLKQSSHLSTVIDEAAALSQDPALSTNIIENAPEDNDEFEILEETVIEEVPKKNRGRKASKKIENKF
ncbi:32877_t:CDS:2, partial [Gigaspora margarita]